MANVLNNSVKFFHGDKMKDGRYRCSVGCHVIKRTLEQILEAGYAIHEEGTITERIGFRPARTIERIYFIRK